MEKRKQSSDNRTEFELIRNCLVATIAQLIVVEWQLNGNRTDIERKLNGKRMSIDWQSLCDLEWQKQQQNNRTIHNSEWQSNGNRTEFEWKSNGNRLQVYWSSDGNRMAIARQYKLTTNDNQVSNEWLSMGMGNRMAEEGWLIFEWRSIGNRAYMKWYMSSNWIIIQ